MAARKTTPGQPAGSKPTTRRATAKGKTAKGQEAATRKAMTRRTGAAASVRMPRPKTPPASIYGGGPGQGITLPPYFKPTPSVVSASNFFPQGIVAGAAELLIDGIGQQISGNGRTGSGQASPEPLVLSKLPIPIG